MTEEQKALAARCLAGSENGSMTFPQIIGALVDGGFESYAVDMRRETATYYLPDGDSLVIACHHSAEPVAARFDADALRTAIGEAQALAPGYTYLGFCDKARAAGCAGYIVSFTGRRALYLGRTAETHVEPFPV
jgi:uncharacterized protein YbcV (DUF1398 family)